jgi:hypothetical protein
LERSNTVLLRWKHASAALRADWGSLESGFGAQEAHMSAMLGLLVRVGERIEAGAR